MKLLLDGQLISSEEAVISVYDHGFLYGMGLFETFRTYGGKPWLLERHARRLAAGCEALGFRYRPDPVRMAEAITRLLEANGLADGYVRWSVSAGESILGLPSDDYARPREIVYMKALAPDEPATRSGKPLRLLRLRRSGPESDIRLKSFHYMNNILAKRELQSAGAAPGTEGLFLSESGYVSEGLVSNVFWLSRGTLYTPSAEAGPLSGVTASFVAELARDAGWPVEAGLYRWEQLAGADEIFVTSSIQEIVPVTSVLDDSGTTLRQWAEAGPLTRRLMHDYRQAAESGNAT